MRGILCFLLKARDKFLLQIIHENILYIFPENCIFLKINSLFPAAAIDKNTIL